LSWNKNDNELALDDCHEYILRMILYRDLISKSVIIFTFV